MARLDRLGPAKESAQVGAVLGREFTYEVLQAVTALDEDRLQQGLQRLVEAELVHQRGLPPRARYIFRHALVQETAYESLLKSTRQRLHGQVAQVLETRFAKAVETQPELVAHHYTEAGLVAQAIPYWQQAGQRATQRSANREAINHLTKGLILLQTMPDGPARMQQELVLRTALGLPLMMTKGYAADDVEANFVRARELCQHVGETPYLFAPLWGLWAFYVTRGESKETLPLARQILSLAEHTQNPVFRLHAHYALGASFFWRAEFVSAREHLDQAIAMYDALDSLPPVFRAAGDPGAACRAYAAFALWHLGYPEQALTRSNEAITLARKLAHPFTLAYILDFAAVVHQLRGEPQVAQEVAEAAIAICTEQRFAHWLNMGTIVHGAALAAQGQRAEGIALMRRGLAATGASGARSGWPYYHTLLAEFYQQDGHTQEGLASLGVGLALSQKNHEIWWEPESYRVKGELTLAQSRVQSLASGVQTNQKAKGKRQKSKITDPRSLIPDPQSEAELCFLKAIDIARRQQAKSLELRAATSLARLWQSQGKYHAARNTLSEVYKWFTEGFDTADLRAAKALLEALS
jgi:predicted ATPase